MNYHLDELEKIPDLHYKAIDYVFENGLVDPGGLWLEFGCFAGGCLKRIAKWNPDKSVFGFDSFEGLPENWTGRVEGVFNKGAFTLGGTIPPPVEPNAFFVKGLFAYSLPGFLRDHPGKISFIHIDSDIYASCRDVLNLCASRIANGCIIVFDEMVGYTNFENHEWKAWWEWVDLNCVKFEWIGGNRSRELRDAHHSSRRLGKRFQFDTETHVSDAYENVAARIIKNHLYLAQESIL